MASKQISCRTDKSSVTVRVRKFQMFEFLITDPVTNLARNYTISTDEKKLQKKLSPLDLRVPALRGKTNDGNVKFLS